MLLASPVLGKVLHVWKKICDKGTIGRKNLHDILREIIKCKHFTDEIQSTVRQGKAGREWACCPYVKWTKEDTFNTMHSGGFLQAKY